MAVQFSGSFSVPEEKLSLETRVPLKHGSRSNISMPVLGLGLWKTNATKVVQEGLAEGYSLFDTAALYQNEQAVGRVLTNNEAFVTTKLWNEDQGYDTTLAACEESRKKLEREIDLYLIHYPIPKKRLESWRAMETLLEEGKVNSIGVSNYEIRHLEELMESSATRPAVNQIEIHPWLQRHELVDFCKKNDIVVEAYSPLATGAKLTDSKLLAMAQKYNKTPAQILIRWSLQNGFVCIPKGSRRERIHENKNVFGWRIDEDDLKVMREWDTNTAFCWSSADEP